MKSNTAKDKKDRLKRNEDKWTPTLMNAGWTVLPSIILDCQKRLELDSIDINILMHLASHWWYSENPPHPSKRKIADCMNVDESTVRRHIKKMEDMGLIQRKARYDKIYGQRTNEYLFEGLIKAATPLAEEAIDARDQKRGKDEARRTKRGNVNLRVVEKKSQDKSKKRD